jgi:hypothetical protein
MPSVRQVWSRLWSFQVQKAVVNATAPGRDAPEEGLDLAIRAELLVLVKRHSRTLAQSMDRLLDLGGYLTPGGTSSTPNAHGLGSADPGRSGSARHLLGGGMPTVFGYHDVKDKDHWLASPKREEFFGPLGVTNIRTFVDPENPTRVGVLMDVSDMDAVMAAMETEAAAEAMAYDGVLPETLVILVEA